MTAAPGSSTPRIPGSLPGTRTASPEARLFLSWGGPWGAPAARHDLAAACGDTTALDTLYLTFDPGKDASEFVGASGTLFFHPAAGTSLGTFWKSRGGALTGTPFRVIWESDSARGFFTPWSPQGAGAPFYDELNGAGRLRIIYAIAENSGPGVGAGRRYGFCRVLVRRPAAGSDGCGQAMCVEWRSAQLGYSPEDQGYLERGERWVTINSGDGKACEPAPAVIGAKPWKPPGSR